MEQHNLYNYSYPQRQRSPGPPANTRPSGAYQNSSAFSASANPDEDWTKISDLAERRRIQNRIAQRNYRKKLKRRLEDLEKRTSSSSPEQHPQEISRQPSNAMSIALRGSSQRRSSQSTVASSEAQYSPDFPSSTDGYWTDARQSTAQQYPYSYPGTAAASFAPVAPAVDYFPTDYSTTDYPASNQLYATSASCQSGYLQTASPSLPNMLGCVESHSEPQYGNGAMLNAFDVNYASLAGVGMPVSQSAGYTARTPPLTDSTSQLSSSRECSPPYFRPLTPDSRSMSPNVHLFSC